ncbi:MAG: hypothetical protein R2719_11760 [Micropruina sp.]
MTDDDLDPLSRLRGLAAFSTADPYEQLSAGMDKPHWEAAANVLRKARAVLRDDPARAGAYVDVALRLPYDEDEQREPAALQAHLMLYTLVSDVAEESDRNDPAWLDAAIDVLEASDAAGRAELGIVLDIIGRDYQVPPAELRKLHRAVAGVEPAPTLHDERFPAALLKERILAVLELCERYEDALDEYYA